MPTIEFFGFGDEARREVERQVRAAVEPEPFCPDCVFVEAPPTRVRAWDGEDRPFVRVSTRSAERAARFRELLRTVCDLEVVRIDFQPREDADDRADQ